MNSAKNDGILSFSESGNVLTCLFLQEKMNTENMGGAEAEILSRLEAFKGGSVVFDLAKVSYVCSSFLRICVRVSNKLGTGKLLLKNSSPEVKKVFKISGLSQMLAG